jgi:hypothetical protein
MLQPGISRTSHGKLAGIHFGNHAGTVTAHRADDAFMGGRHDCIAEAHRLPWPVRVGWSIVGKLSGTSRKSLLDKPSRTPRPSLGFADKAVAQKPRKLAGTKLSA